MGTKAGLIVFVVDLEPPPPILATAKTPETSNTGTSDFLVNKESMEPSCNITTKITKNNAKTTAPGVLFYNSLNLIKNRLKKAVFITYWLNFQ